MSRRAALGLLGALLGCRAPDPEPLAARPAGVVDAAPAPDPADDAIVALGPRRLLCPGVLEARCTGVLVAPSLVLTAAHCVEDARAGDLEVAFGGDVRTPSHVEAVAAIEVAPGRGDDPVRSDLALVHLRRAVAEAPRALASAPPAPGQSVRAVGFGRTAPGSPTGVRRAGLVAVESVDDGVITYGPGPAMTCGGDSGGPLLDASGAVVGVTRSGDEACALVGRALGSPLAAALVAGAAAVSMGSIHDGPTCAGACADDLDCAPEARCLRGEDGVARRCGYLGLPAGAPAEACRSDADCAAADGAVGACAAVGAGEEQVCRCWRPCMETMDTAGPALDVSGGGGCAAGGARPAGAGAVLAGAALLRAARRRRSRGR